VKSAQPVDKLIVPGHTLHALYVSGKSGWMVKPNEFSVKELLALFC
jgi:hypothetical protein